MVPELATQLSIQVNQNISTHDANGNISNVFLQPFIVIWIFLDVGILCLQNSAKSD